MFLIRCSTHHHTAKLPLAITTTPVYTCSMFSFHFLCLVVFTCALFLKVKSNIKYLTVDVADKNIINTEVKIDINAIVFVLF